MLTRIYRTVAAAAACLLAAVGGVVLAVVSPAAFAAVIGTGAGVGVIVAMHLPHTEPPARSKAGHAVEIGVAAAAVAVFGLLAMVGAFAMLGAAAGPLFLVLLGVTGAGLWRHRAAWRAYAGAVTRPATPAQPADTAADAPRRPAETPQPPSVAPQIVSGPLTVRALCLAWHRSHWSLQSLPAGPGRAELITTRGRLLDELEQRDPVGFHRWLHRGVRATSDPSHYLTEHRAPPTRSGSPRRHDDGGRPR